MIDQHHLLECILWPNPDGSFRKIVNTQKRLRKLGIYDDHLTIPIPHGMHASMHLNFKKGTAQDHHKTGVKSANWRGGVAKSARPYREALAKYKDGELSEAEMDLYREEWTAYNRERRRRRLESSKSRI